MKYNNTATEQTIKKSKRRDKKIAKDNAQSLVTKSVSRLGVGHNFLTRYAASLVSTETELSKRCCGIQYDKDTFYIHTPDKKIGQVKNVLPPRFSRLRKVCFDKTKDLSCSCGYSVRNKLPCRHILYLTGKCSMEMVAPRWMKMYQYAFERINYQNLTELYRLMEAEHYSRDIEKKETIYVNDYTPKYADLCEQHFPKRLFGTTVDQMNDINYLIEINKRKGIVIRGFPIKEQLQVKSLPENYSDTNMVVDFSQDTLEMIDNDMDFIKTLQNQITSSNNK